MMVEKIVAPQVPKYKEVKELKESLRERLVRESYEIEFDSYNGVGVSRGYGSCLDDY